MSSLPAALPLLRPDGVLPNAALPSLPAPQGPVRALMFGTGALLRGLVASVFENARLAGVYDGTILAVESTGGGRSALLNKQGGWFTEAIEGMDKGAAVKRIRVNGAIRGALAASQWPDVLQAACAPEVSLIVSNTTEVGIRYEPDDLFAAPPLTFPGKLTAVLMAIFERDPSRRMAILPCELVPENGSELKALVIRHAREAQLPAAFFDWLEARVAFCNTLVDRIVTGTPSDEALPGCWEKAGFRDALYTVAEPYGLWAIECPASFRDLLGFAYDPEIIPVSDDITPYRERKLRILNGTHTISIPLALQSGFKHVKSAMTDPLMGRFFERVAIGEIAPTVNAPGAVAFAREVLDRFRNPFIDHKLEDIAFQSSAKMRMRNVATLHRYAATHGHCPPLMALGFAALIRLLRPVSAPGAPYTVEAAGRVFPLRDEGSEAFRQWWASYSALRPEASVRELLSSTELWGADLHEIPGLTQAISDWLPQLLEGKAREALTKALAASLD